MTFNTFLLGTVLVSSLALLALLAAPRRDSQAASRVPAIGALAAALLVAIGFIAGLSAGS
jgi:hypothetical protein